jgi:bacterioferritin (cytochrome b1)
MPWNAAASYMSLVSALNAAIVQEVTAADHYLQLARFVEQLQKPGICDEIAVCAATAMSNATALAAELMALGGAPPSSLVPKRSSLPAASSIEEHLIEARAELAHYQGRLAFARRLGLLRLQEVFREIVLSKRRHLAHARLIASAYVMRRGTKTEMERSDANRSTYE